MRTFKSLSLKEKLEYIGIVAIYPLILLCEQIGKSFKFLNSRSKQITASILTVCLMLTMIPVMSLSVFAKESTNNTRNAFIKSDEILGSQQDTVYMGKYAQSSDGNGDYIDEGIAWRVLENNTNGNLFLHSDKNLDMVIYHRANNYSGINWSNSLIRNWLNSVFYNVAFTDIERSVINTTNLGNNVNDNIFLLSNEEAGNSAYFPNGNSSRIVQNTEYAESNGVFSANGTGWWWLRSNGGQTGLASRVFDDGSINSWGYYMDCTDNGIRPAMKINKNNIAFVSSATGEKTAKQGRLIRLQITITAVGN